MVLYQQPVKMNVVSVMDPELLKVHVTVAVM